MSKNRNAASGKNSRQKNNNRQSACPNGIPDLLKLLRLPISYHRCLVEVADGGIPGAILLSRCMWWQQAKTNSRHKGWWWHTFDDWHGETGMTRRQVKLLLKKFDKAGILETQRLNGNKTHYRVNLRALWATLQSDQKVQSRSTKRFSPDCTKGSVPPQKTSARDIKQRHQIDATPSQAQSSRYSERAVHLSPSGREILFTPNKPPNGDEAWDYCDEEGYWEHNQAGCEDILNRLDECGWKPNAKQVCCWPKYLDTCPALNPNADPGSVSGSAKSTGVRIARLPRSVRTVAHGTPRLARVPRFASAKGGTR